MKLEEIAENHGLTPEGVDYALTQYQTVICEITHGMMSKLSYDAKDIIRMAQERWCDTCELKEQEPIEPRWYEADDSWSCGNCGETVGYGMYNPLGPARNKYCKECGKRVKWI